MNKYQPLKNHLKNREASQYPLTFQEIENIIGGGLPPSAYRHRAWWSNNPSNSVMTKAWLEAGWVSSDVDLEGRKLVFRRVPRPAHAPPFRGPAPATPTGRNLTVEDIPEQVFSQLKARAELAGESVEKTACRILAKHAQITLAERLAIADRIRATSPNLHNTDVVSMIRQDRDAR